MTRLISRWYVLVRGQDLAGEFHVAAAQRAALALAAGPAEVEAEQLPERIQAQAARHDGILEEVAPEEPHVRLDGQFGVDQTAIVGAAVVGNATDLVEHEHVVDRQARIARTEGLAVAAGDQLLVGKRLFCHPHRLPVSCFLRRIRTCSPRRSTAQSIGRVYQFIHVGRPTGPAPGTRAQRVPRMLSHTNPAQAATAIPQARASAHAISRSHDGSRAVAVVRSASRVALRPGAARYRGGAGESRRLPSPRRSGRATLHARCRSSSG